MDEKEKENLTRAHLGFELIGGILGWLWIISCIATIAILFLAIFSKISWWWLLIFYILSRFLKQVFWEYRKEWVKTGQMLSYLESNEQKNREE